MLRNSKVNYKNILARFNNWAPAMFEREFNKFDGIFKSNNVGTQFKRIPAFYVSIFIIKSKFNSNTHPLNVYFTQWAICLPPTPLFLYDFQASVQ